MNAPVPRLDRRARARARAQARAVRMPLMPSLQRRRLQCYLALMIADIAALAGSFGLVGWLYRGEPGAHQSLVLVQLLLPVFLTAGIYTGAYSIGAIARRAVSVGRVLQALVIGFAVVLLLVFYTKSGQEFSRAEFTLGALLSALVLGVERDGMRGFVRWRCGAVVTNDLVIDDGGPSISLPGAYQVNAASFGITPSLADPHALDRLGLVMRNADRVIVSSPAERRAEWAIVLKGANVAGEVIDDTVAALAAIGARRAGGRGLLQVSTGPLGMRARITKRGFDLVVAGGALLALAPVMAIAAVAIRLEDGGPVLFVQRRVGRGNRFFSILKFRTMVVNSEGVDGAASTVRGDARVTPIGRVLRRTSIDELPQLINVVIGDMSLVGPRPHAIQSCAGDKLFWEVDARYWERHALKPGLTGLAQVRGLRGGTPAEADLAGRLDADLEYVAGWSLWRDFAILLATFRVLVHECAF